MLKHILWAFLGLLVVVALVAGLSGVKFLQFKEMGDAMAAMEIPPEIVNAIDVREDRWPVSVSAVGSVAAVQGIVVSAEVEGIVRSIHFEPGTTVTAGALLVQLDVDVENAQLRAAEASAQLTRVQFQRAKELVESRNISQAEFDEAAAAMQEAQAQVDNLQAVIAKKSIRAPFGGKLGIMKLSPGEFLQKGSPVVSLQSLDPVYVEFSLPQQWLGQVREGQTVVVRTDVYPGQKFEGTITAINPQVDQSTRSMLVQATFENGDHRLRPGMYIAAEVLLGDARDVLVIPATAVVNAPYGDSVFVIDEQTTTTKSGETTTSLFLRQEVVKLGERKGDFVVVEDGLTTGERVVSTGVFKLKPQTRVEIDNTLAPEFKLSPDPKNT